MSWMVPLSAWPMCRTPVTFGGGIMTVKVFPLPSPSAGGWKQPAASHFS